jgi:hypothetical protein
MYAHITLPYGSLALQAVAGLTASVRQPGSKRWPACRSRRGVGDSPVTPAGAEHPGSLRWFVMQADDHQQSIPTAGHVDAVGMVGVYVNRVGIVVQPA